MKKIMFPLLLMLSAVSHADHKVSEFAQGINEWARYGTAQDDPTHVLHIGLLAGYIQGTLSHVTSDLMDKEVRVCHNAIYKTQIEENVATFVKFANERRDEWDDRDMKSMVWLSMLYEHGPASECSW